MHARDLVELAALTSQHGPLLIASDAPLSPNGLERYWSASKCRLDRWGRALRRLTEAPAGTDSIEQTNQDLGMLEEILTGEVLARVWAAILVAHDRRTADESSVIARSVLVGQLEARNRALSLLVNGPALASRHAVRLNRLRRRAECWSDLLVGYLDTTVDVSEFGADRNRTRNFHEDFRQHRRREWPLLLTSLRASFATAFDQVSPNIDLNAEIAASILCFFQSELFDATGTLRSQWVNRLMHTTDETQGLIDSLFAIDHAPAIDVVRVAAPRAGYPRRF